MIFINSINRSLSFQIRHIFSNQKFTHHFPSGHTGWLIVWIRFPCLSFTSSSSSSFLLPYLMLLFRLREPLDMSMRVSSESTRLSIRPTTGPRSVHLPLHALLLQHHPGRLHFGPPDGPPPLWVHHAMGLGGQQRQAREGERYTNLRSRW